MGCDCWADAYLEKRRTATEAMELIRPGQRVFIGSSCGEPQHLIRKLFLKARSVSDVEIVRLFSLENIPLTLVADKTDDQLINIRSFYLGSAQSKTVAAKMRFLTPINLSEVPHLFTSRKLPLDVALIQVSPPDDFGWMSLGIAVDVTLAAALSADRVIAQVNSRMPRVLGRSFVHVNDVDVIVEHDERLLTIDLPQESDTDHRIAANIERLIEDGSTLHMGLGTAARAVLRMLSSKKDIGIHTHHLTDDMMQLMTAGVITNRFKGYNDGKLVASSAVGSQSLYEFVNDNPAIEFHPSDYVNDPFIISRHHRMVAVDVAMAVDLTGQVAAEALPQNRFCGVNDMADFMRGAVRSNGGKTILLLPSTFDDGTESRIVARLDDASVVVARGDVHYVASEYGVVNLFGKSYQERAMAMLSIAHPDFRETLFNEAKARGLIGPERRLRPSIRGVYPQQFEEAMDIDGVHVVIRPSKPDDERRIQEHYYGLDKTDVISRFFNERKNFYRKSVEGISQVDYVHDFAFVAVAGDPGFARVVGVGEYYLEAKGNIAEISFSVSQSCQGKGLGRRLIRKLAEAAHENNIGGLVAYVSPGNRRMVNLFKTLPFEVAATHEGGMIALRCRFDTPCQPRQRG